jgi:hypothetical protein
MKKISKLAKSIADAHIQARLNGTFDDPTVKNREELIQQLKEGKTFSQLLDQIEIKFTSITSILLSRKLFHQSQNYKKGVYKGFKTLIDQ